MDGGHTSNVKEPSAFGSMEMAASEVTGPRKETKIIGVVKRIPRPNGDGGGRE